MTTPGGVPNLPMGALTIDNLADHTQDMSSGAMKTRAVQRFPSIMGSSTGLDPALDFTPFGILTNIWAGVNSSIANADPADVQGPDDLPPLILDFITGLPLAITSWIRTAFENLGLLFGIDIDALTDEAFDAVDVISGFVTNIIDDVIDQIESVTGIDLTFLHSLVDGFSNTGTIIEQLYDALTGRGPTGGLSDLATWASDLPLAGDLIQMFTGSGSSGLFGLSGLGSVLGDFTGLLGSPTGLGTGSVGLPGLGSIPILGGLLSGGVTLLGSLIPGLDASKITTGSFGTSTSGPLGGLFGGAGSFLTSFIPGLDVSKIISGVFGGGFIPGLDASKVTTGQFGTGTSGPLGGLFSGGGSFLTSLIPGLDVSKIVSGVFGSGLIPGLDASKITSGQFGMGQITGLLSAFSGIDLGGATPIATYVQGYVSTLMGIVSAIQNALGATLFAPVTASSAASASTATAAAATSGAVTATVVNTYTSLSHATANIGSSLNGYIRQFLGW